MNITPRLQNELELMCQNLDLRFRPFIAFCQVFFLAPFSLFLTYRFIVFSPFLIWFFLSPFVFPFFFTLVLYLFSHVVSALAYPNLLGNKRLGCCCCC
jgi:hypothetical protein